MAMTRESRLKAARFHEARAHRKEASARRLLAEAAVLRDKARTLRQRANGQAQLPLTHTPRRRKSRLLIQTQAFHKLLHEANLQHAEFARQLGIARSTWSQLLNRHRAVTPQMKIRLQNHPLIAGRPETALWEPET